jgi:hypothetical protein
MRTLLHVYTSRLIAEAVLLTDQMGTSPSQPAADTHPSPATAQPEAARSPSASSLSTSSSTSSLQVDVAATSPPGLYEYSSAWSACISGVFRS